MTVPYIFQGHWYDPIYLLNTDRLELPMTTACRDSWLHNTVM